MIRILILAASLLTLTACSTVSKLLPGDRREEYKKSEPLPDLEIPPDLTASSENPSMNIPGETQASLSEYRNKQQQKNTPAAQQQNSQTDINWVVVKGDSQEIWPELRKYFSGKGYSFELDDAELGVLGTEWSEPVTKGNALYRNRYKVFSEPGAEAGVLVIYVSNNVQMNSAASNSKWVDNENNIDAEKQTVGELNLYFNNINLQSPSSVAPFARGGSASIELTSEGSILHIPSEYTASWIKTERALQRAGLIISSSNESQGMYNISYHEVVEKKKKGIISRLAFWKKNDNGDEGIPYTISLTGVGESTELIILNEDGGWDNSDTANHIIGLIRDQL